MSDPERADAIARYTDSLLESRNWEVKLKNLRLEIKDLEKEFNQTEENIKALQSVGQIIGEVLKQLDEERCTFTTTAHLAKPGVPILLWQPIDAMLTIAAHSHCQSILRPSICRRLPLQG